MKEQLPVTPLLPYRSRRVVRLVRCKREGDLVRPRIPAVARTLYLVEPLRRCRAPSRSAISADELGVRHRLEIGRACGSKSRGRTIEPKTRIRQGDNEGAKCSASGRLTPPSGFYACTPSSTTPSIFYDISSRARRSGYSEPRRRTSGGMR